MHGDVEPELLGPFGTESSRTDRARLHREEHGDEDGLYRVNATGTVDVDSYTGREIEPTDESEQVAMGLDPIPDDTPSLDPPLNTRGRRADGSRHGETPTGEQRVRPDGGAVVGLRRRVR